MREYFLFLDESKNTPPSEYFALGGLAIEKKEYQEKVCPFIRTMKKSVFDDEDIILHETELRLAKKDGYKIMRRVEKRTLFWQEMGRLFDENDITVFTAVINPAEFKQIYNSKYLHDEYFVCLEIIMENFAHFLEKQNAVGTIYLESQNPKADNRLSNHFYQLIKRGTRHLSNHALREKIISINFYQKADRNIGLQLADFIPNTLKKYANGILNKQPSIETNIVKCLYDGKIGKSEIFGLKNVDLG